MANSEFIKKSKEIKETYSELALEFKTTHSDLAFSKLYQKMYPSIFNYVFNILRDYDETADAVSNAMYNVYTKIEQFDPTYQITTWAYKIAYHEAIRILREKSTKISISIDDIPDNGIPSDQVRSIENGSLKILNDNNNDYDRDEKSYLEEEEELISLYNKMKEQLSSLKPIYKDIMNYRFNENMSYLDIVEKYNLPYKEEYDELERILIKLKKEYENDDSDANKKKRYYDIWYKLEDFKKKNMITEQTVKNRLRRAKMIIVNNLKGDKEFEIYNKKIKENA